MQSDTTVKWLVGIVFAALVAVLCIGYITRTLNRAETQSQSHLTDSSTIVSTEIGNTGN